MVNDDDGKVGSSCCATETAIATENPYVVLAEDFGEPHLDQGPHPLPSR